MFFFGAVTYMLMQRRVDLYIAYRGMAGSRLKKTAHHGFLLIKTRWRLSPLYDVNPVPYGDTLALNVSAEDNSISMELAVSVAKYFQIKETEAEKAVKEIRGTVRDNWERIAGKCGCSRKAREYMKPAFEQCYLA